MKAVLCCNVLIRSRNFALWWLTFHTRVLNLGAPLLWTWNQRGSSRYGGFEVARKLTLFTHQERSDLTEWDLDTLVKLQAKFSSHQCVVTSFLRTPGDSKGVHSLISFLPLIQIYTCRALNKLFRVNNILGLKGKKGTPIYLFTCSQGSYTIQEPSVTKVFINIIWISVHFRDRKRVGSFLPWSCGGVSTYLSRKLIAPTDPMAVFHGPGKCRGEIAMVELCI